MQGIFQNGHCKRGNPNVGGFAQFLFSLDVFGDEVNDYLLLQFLGQREVLLTSAPLTVYVLICHVRLVSKEGGPQISELCLPTAGPSYWLAKP